MSDFVLKEAETVSLLSIAREVGTPFYHYDAQKIRAQYENLTATLPGVIFFYSLKANPNLSVVRALVECGMGCEVSSYLELETALAAGVVSDRILMVGPGKGADELRHAVQLGIKAIVVESLAELDQINRLAEENASVQPVALRINPDFQVKGARLAMSGRATQFGIEQADFEEAIAYAGALPHIRLAGLHIYMGTRILCHETVTENTRNILDFATKFAAFGGKPLDFVDVGGGFGVPYYPGEADLDLEKVGDGLRPLISDFKKANPDTAVAIELGRYMVGAAGLFVTSIRQIKSSKGTRFAVCDGGSNVHSAAAGQGFMRHSFPVSLVSIDKNAESAPKQPEPWTITGPLCTPMDIIAKGVELAAPQPGDLICFHQSGAYGPTASPVNFLGFGAPAEVMQDGELVTIVRDRPTNQEMLEAQRPRTICDHRPILISPEFVTAGSFDDERLDGLEKLRPLFQRVGEALERDPQAWQDLWADDTVRALTTIGVPETFNGFPLSGTDLGIQHCSHAKHVALIERLARFDVSCILALPGPSLSGGAVLAAGTDQQIERFFKAYRTGPQGTFFAVTEPEVGSDASNGSTVLSPDERTAGFLLSGSKMLVGNVARARIGLVFARREDTGRPVLVMIEPSKAEDCIKIDRLPTHGLHGADLCRLDLDQFPVSQEMILGGGGPSLRDGFMAINGVFERNRPVVAALALGNSRGILDHLRQCGVSSERLEGLKLGYQALIARLASVLEDAAAGCPRTHRISEIKMQSVAFSDEVFSWVFEHVPELVFSDPFLRRKCRDAKAFEYMEGTSNIHLLNAFRSFVSEVRQ